MEQCVDLCLFRLLCVGIRLMDRTHQAQVHSSRHHVHTARARSWPFVLSNGGGGGRNLQRNYTVLSPKCCLFVSNLLIASSKKSNSLVRDSHPEIPRLRTLGCGQAQLRSQSVPKLSKRLAQCCDTYEDGVCECSLV